MAIIFVVSAVCFVAGIGFVATGARMLGILLLIIGLFLGVLPYKLDSIDRHSENIQLNHTGARTGR